MLLLHGWPTSSFLWRDVMAPIARTSRVARARPARLRRLGQAARRRYDFGFFERAIDGFLDALGIDEVGVAAHDLGGPVAAHWAMRSRSSASPGSRC